MPKIKINLLGDGIELRYLQLDVARYNQWTEIAERQKRNLADLLIDPFFYHKLKDEKIASFLDLESSVTSGILNTERSQVEIWFNRHKVLKVKMYDLFNESLLFPLYKLENAHKLNSNKLEKGFYIIRKEIGLVASLELEIEAEKLEIDNFIFDTNDFESERFLSRIKYQNQEMKFKKSDSLTTFQTCFEVI